MEFKNGDAERGRTIFENILANYAKRVDLWSVYLDQELRLGNAESIRALFDRVITMNFSSKKMKFFFKRYLEFEREHGDEGTISAVKDKAREYVQARTSD
jgi:rRNA biogenesis protein RRP5